MEADPSIAATTVAATFGPSRFSIARGFGLCNFIYIPHSCTKKSFVRYCLSVQVPRALTAIIDRANPSYLPFLYDNYIVEARVINC